MLRQYRIERANGMEFVVQETYRKHTFSKDEHSAWLSWRDSQPDNVDHVSQADFRSVVLEQLTILGKTEFFGLKQVIPVYESFPCVVIRAGIYNNKPVEFYISSDPSEVSPVVISELTEFVGIFDGHWRNMISCQRDRYGELFSTDND